MRRPSYVPALAALAAVVLAACAEVGLLESLVSPLTLELSVPVDSMVPGDRVETTIIVRNRSDRTVHFHGGGCTFGIEVVRSDGSSLNRLRDGNSVPGTLDGGQMLMRTAPIPIPGGETRTLILLDGPGGLLTGALIDP